MEETLGKRISAHRKRCGLTQDKLADRLGVTAQAVSKWENDLSCPDITMLPKLARIFGITTDELLGITPAQPVHEAEVVSDDGPDIHITKESGSGWEFSWDAGRKNHLTAAIWVLCIGVLLLLSRYFRLDAGFWDICWSSALLVFGLSATFRRFSIAGIVCALFGGQSMLEQMGVLEQSIGWELVLPLAIVLLGLHLVYKAFRKPKKQRFHIHRGHRGGHHAGEEFRAEGESFTCTTAFGDERRVPQLDRLKSGSATLAFGDLSVDLTQCKTFAPDARVDLSCGFGDLTLLVPKSCRVNVSTSKAFGSVDVQGHPDPEASECLIAECSVAFGNITVHYI